MVHQKSRPTKTASCKMSITTDAIKHLNWPFVRSFTPRNESTHIDTPYSRYGKGIKRKWIGLNTGSKSSSSETPGRNFRLAQPTGAAKVRGAYEFPATVTSATVVWD